MVLLWVNSGGRPLYDDAGDDDVQANCKLRVDDIAVAICRRYSMVWWQSSIAWYGVTWYSVVIYSVV